MSRPRPTYGYPIKEIGDPPRDATNKYAFWFSDDIRDWYGTSAKRREKQKEYFHANKKRSGYKTKHG